MLGRVLLGPLWGFVAKKALGLVLLNILLLWCPGAVASRLR